MRQSSDHDLVLVACTTVPAFVEVSANGGPGVWPLFEDGARPFRSVLAGKVLKISFEQWRSNASIERHVPSYRVASEGAVCLCIDEPHCRAVAELLRHKVGKRLEVTTEASNWSAQLADLINDPTVASLTIILPLWSNTGLDSTWVARCLREMRNLRPDGSGPAWGILTGTNPAALACAAIKSLIAAEALDRYREAPAAVVTIHPAVSSRFPLPRWHSSSQGDAPLQWIEPVYLTEALEALTRKPWSAIIFHGHGRSYCACDGVLCGARTPNQSPNAETAGCVLGFNCADPSYPRIDPRSYEAFIQVMDTCDAASCTAETWRTGIPPLAYLAMEGSAAAVIASDGITECTSGDFFDILWALQGAKRAGDAPARLNRLRRSSNLPQPYFLLGDPDLPFGADLWPRWTVQAPAEAVQGETDGWIARPPQSVAPILHVRIPVQETGEQSNLFVWREDGYPGAAPCRIFRQPDHVDVWLPHQPAASPVRVVERPSIRLPDTLLEAARELPRRLGDWKPPLCSAAPRLTTAAARVMNTDQLLELIEGKGIGAKPEELTRTVTVTLTEWMAAQAACIKELLHQAENGLWPQSCWNPRFAQPTISEAPCPRCGLTPTVERPYHLSSGLSRLWWECPRCDLITDLPSPSLGVDFSLHASEALAPYIEGHARVRLSVEAGPRWGAGAVVVDRTGHGLEAVPASFSVRCEPGRPQSIEVALRPAAAPERAHAYRVRAVVLLDGWWFWASRPLRVGVCETAEHRRS